jgi:hypothetical protein
MARDNSSCAICIMLIIAFPFIATPLAGIERIGVDKDNLCKYDREVLGYNSLVYRNSRGRIIVKDGIDTKLSGTLMNLFDFNPYWMDEYYCDLTWEQQRYFRKAVSNAESIEGAESLVTSKDMTKEKLLGQVAKNTLFNIFNRY